MVNRTKPSGCCPLEPVAPLSQEDLRRAAAAAKALSDPNRIEIIRLLAGQAGPVCACDIVEHFNLSQPTISHHLKILREAGLLKSAKRGLWVFYAVHPDGARVLGRLTGLLDAARGTRSEKERIVRHRTTV